MSYCRFSGTDSDVYMYPSTRGIECCGCRLLDNYASSPTFLTRAEAILHLVEHLQRGDAVPHYAIGRLAEEIRECGDEY